MNRCDILRNRIKQCKELAEALPDGKVKDELEKLAGEQQCELDALNNLDQPFSGGHPRPTSAE